MMTLAIMLLLAIGGLPAAALGNVMGASRGEQLELQSSGAYLSPEAKAVFARHLQDENAWLDAGVTESRRALDFAVAQHRASWLGLRRGASYRGYTFALSCFPRHVDALAWWWFELDDAERWEWAMSGAGNHEAARHRVDRCIRHLRRVLPALEDSAKSLADEIGHPTANGDWSRWSLARIINTLNSLRSAAAGAADALAQTTPALHRSGRLEDWRAAVKHGQRLDQTIEQVERRIISAGLKKICQGAL